MFMHLGIGRLKALVLAMIVARILIGILSPFIAITCKWLIIGRYKPGRYPLWGSMYLRWWIVEQIIRIMGKGYLSGDIPIIGPHGQRLYLRLMGIKLGRNVKIGKGTSISQFDLVTIEDGVVLDDCLVRPFGLEKNHFVLLPIIIGRRSSIGAKSTIAPGAVIPPDTHVGPLSSSHELEDSSPKNKEYCRPLSLGPPLHLMIFIGAPILLVVTLISYMPWYLLILNMEHSARNNGWYMDDINTIVDAFSWWCTPKRLPYYFVLRILRRTVVPPIKLAAVIFVKKFFIGKFKQQDKERMNKPWNRFRYWLMANLMDGSDLCGVAYLVGRHYEIISSIYRLLGAKVGQRVYWPGSGFDIVEYDLLEIGDDVVFGSRSIIMTRSTERSAKVVIADNAMLGNCVYFSL
jgi:acetyltransferase-like isoleucine patch superfamily enzyme